MLQRGRETWRKERRETVRERDLWEEERPELVTVRVWGEKKQMEEKKKVRKLTMRERRHQKIMFPMTTDKDNIYRRYNAWERDCFPNFFFWKTTYLTKNSFLLTILCVCVCVCVHARATKHWKMWKLSLQKVFQQNKQSVKYVGPYLPKPVFNHG